MLFRKRFYKTFQTAGDADVHEARGPVDGDKHKGRLLFQAREMFEINVDKPRIRRFTLPNSGFLLSVAGGYAMTDKGAVNRAA